MADQVVMTPAVAVAAWHGASPVPGDHGGADRSQFHAVAALTVAHRHPGAAPGQLGQPIGPAGVDRGCSADQPGIRHSPDRRAGVRSAESWARSQHRSQPDIASRRGPPQQRLGPPHCGRQDHGAQAFSGQVGVGRGSVARSTDHRNGRRCHRTLPARHRGWQSAATHLAPVSEAQLVGQVVLPQGNRCQTILT